MPSLVLLLQDLEFGGTQRYAIRLLRHIHRERLAPELWVLRGGEDLAAQAQEAGRVSWLSRSTWVSPTVLLRLALRLRRRRPDALYTLTVVPNIWGRILGRLVGVPVILAGYRNQHPAQWERLLWRLSDRVVYNAECLRRELDDLGVPAGRSVLVPNGVDVVGDIELPDPPPTTLFVGRLVPQKDPLTLINAFRRVVDALPAARLLVVGDGSLRQDVARRVAELQVGDRVQLLGAVDAGERLSSAHVVVLPSLYEGTPHVVLEAMAAGRPLVATAVGGVPDLVRDGDTGLLVPPGSPESLAEALLKVLTDPRFGRAMASRALSALSAQPSVSEMVRRTEDVVLDALRARGLRVASGATPDEDSADPTSGSST